MIYMNEIEFYRVILKKEPMRTVYSITLGDECTLFKGHEIAFDKIAFNGKDMKEKNLYAIGVYHGFQQEEKKVFDIVVSEAMYDLPLEELVKNKSFIELYGEILRIFVSSYIENFD